MTITIDAVTGISGVDGSAATPAFKGNDANTGISFGTDTVTINTGGVARVTTDASGNVGVGTASPIAKLEVSGAATASGSVSFRVTDTASSLSAQLLRTGSAFSYAGVGANETWLYTQGGSNLSLGPDGAAVVKFVTNGSECARFNSSGNLLVGTTTGDARVSIESSSTNNNVGSLSVKNTNATADACVALFNTATNSTATSNVYIKFAINGGASGGGQINANGASQAAFGGFSDRRLKENIVDLPSQLESIMALRPVEFDYIESEGGGHQIGFIAQEMQKVYTDAVGERSDGMLTVTGWNKTEARLVKAIQEQQTIIANLTARLEALENK